MLLKIIDNRNFKHFPIISLFIKYIKSLLICFIQALNFKYEQKNTGNRVNINFVETLFIFMNKRKEKKIQFNSAPFYFTKNYFFSIFIENINLFGVIKK